MTEEDSTQSGQFLLDPLEVVPAKLSFTTADCPTPSRYNARNKATEPLKVYLRIRPLEVEAVDSVPATTRGRRGRKKKKAEDVKEAVSSCIEQVSDTKVTLLAPKGSKAAERTGEGGGSSQYTFSKVLGEECPQKEVYEEVGRPFVDSLFKGQNGLIFAYGVTNSGKTYTMMGNKENPGLVPRIVEEIFKRLSESDGCSFGVKFSNLEIYNEKIYDLLSGTSRSSLKERPGRPR